jgi:[ribosomal protein S5]-alanine N-acetyltransferase
MIRGTRCILRTVREADLAELILLVNDKSLQGDYLSLPLRSEPSLRKEYAETGFLGDRRGRFLVTDFDGRLLGTVVYFNVNYMDGFELGYHLFDAAARNKGLMGEAVPMATDYLFSHHKINRLQVVIAPDNEPSKRLALKCGFRLEGTLRGNVFHHGTNHDSLLYSLLRADALRRPAEG